MKAFRHFSGYSDVAIIALFMFCCFAYVMFVIGNNSDLVAHAQIAQRMLEGNRLFGNNFLMFFMANLLSGFSGKLILIEIALVVLIALSNTVKYVVVKKELSRMFPARQAMVASAALLFVFVIPVFYFLKIFGVFLTTNNMYFQYYVPNVWHNSTILCMMPFAIITYFLSVRQLAEYDSRRNGWIALCVVLATLVKPSFFFIFGVAYPICMFVKYRFHKEFFYSLLPIVIGCLCVCYEFVTIYDGEDGSGVAISVLPLFTVAFWKSRLMYLAVSMALPLLFVLFYWKEIFKDMEFWFVLIMLVMALGIAWCCRETGSRANHGNFSWQVVSAMWFVYYYILKTILKSRQALEKDNTEERGSKCWRVRVNLAFLIVYGIHVFSGVLYLIKFMVTKDMA